MILVTTRFNIIGAMVDQLLTLSGSHKNTFVSKRFKYIKSFLLGLNVLKKLTLALRTE